jgi:hypothetical protein
MNELAKHAYDAYGGAVGWLNYRGDPMPKWEDLPVAIRTAWRISTQAVVDMLRERDTPTEP